MIPPPDPALPLGDQHPLTLLAMTVFGEARGEGENGIRAVAHAIMNRVNAPRNSFGRRFGLGIIGVVLRPGAFDCMRPLDVNFRKLMHPMASERPDVWSLCCRVALEVQGGLSADPTGAATHYYDDSLKIPPYWARPAVIAAGRMISTVAIGRLRFFRET